MKEADLQQVLFRERPSRFFEHQVVGVSHGKILKTYPNLWSVIPTSFHLLAFRILSHLKAKRAEVQYDRRIHLN